MKRTFQAALGAALSLFASALSPSLLIHPAEAQAPSAGVIPQANLTTSGGAALLPPTGLQSPLPPPALPPPSAKRPLGVSPGIYALPSRLRSGPLTIDDVVALSLSTNSTLATGVEEYLQQEGALTTARAGLNPTLSGSYSQTTYQSGPLFGEAENSGINEATASLDLPIDITGELRAAVSQQAFLKIAAQLEINRVRNIAVLDTKTAFYNVLRDQALVTVAEESLQNDQDQLADAQLRLAAGTVTRYDVTTALTTAASAEQTLIKDRNTLSQAFSTLNNTIGIAVDTPLQLTTRGAVIVPPDAAGSAFLPGSGLKPAPPPENGLNVKPGQTIGDEGAATALQVRDFVVGNPIELGADYDDLVREALSTRAEVLQQDADIAAARRGVEVARSSLLPSLSAGYYVSEQPNGGSYSGQPFTAYGSLTLTVPLADGGEARGKVIQASAEVAEAETNRRGEVDTVTLEVRQAYLNLQQAELAIASARQELAQADESYKLARLRYSAGVVSSTGVSPLIELSDAQESLAQAQSDYINALYDFNNDRSTLDKAVGRYSYTPGLPGFSNPPTSRAVGYSGP